ncbi:hypothetical protein C8R45DRAFT_1204247 [Mycena sanguinolenta]|nr:hypothetical protein C8R45DRAFT_1204247 [Mycena sanguinolenta]
MSSIPEASLAFLTSNPSSTSTPWGLILTGVVAAGLYYASPTRLTCVLVSALADTEKTYLTAVENGLLCASTDVDMAKRLSVLQLEVSALRETSLRSSLSHVSALCDMCNIHRSVTILRCLAEVRELGTYIEISNESRLREIDSRLFCNRATISLRRRVCPSRA